MSSTAKDRKEYHSGYYKRHKQELSDKRKKKYRDDPAVRQKAIDASRAYRAKKKQERAEMIDKGLLPPPRERGPRKPVIVDIGGVRSWANTITVFAQRINRSVEAINNWINIGTLPRTPLRSSRGDRLYTDGMIRVVKTAVFARGIVGKSKDVYEEVKRGWEKLGVFPVDKA